MNDALNEKNVVSALGKSGVSKRCKMTMRRKMSVERLNGDVIQSKDFVTLEMH